ncbi:protein of unknown function [Taphrina deformans PYCC 5710]|uniref:FMN hydroxy acid dehydrogenase domain-containing protein n=1 Tax=Taphrina deformans (strain PYCC 5710 / ATCC 11124 / CBS 356.35 / IMI 108563 / JCM 9778 / NBRC 8474) TaxID=1097556 RepID=R4XDX1_TAPDE|nr:protein of unknown function [Taphrina deformans PYCC 5710]|eukprot:CCG84025.1 protein of unknown function [Taphrina deformans PYCC 5710]
MPFSPTNHSDFQREIYGTLGTRPNYSTDPLVLESQAKEVLTKRAWGYIDGSAALGLTYKHNREAFERYPLIPRMLRDVTKRSTRVTLFGKEYDSPILAAPIGVQGIAHGDGEIATAKACEAQHVPMILSTAATRTIEQAAEANGNGERWYQLYWPRTDAITVSLLRRAREAGYTTLIVTLDTFTLGWRSRDLDESYLPFLFGQGTQIGFSDPAFEKIFANRPATGLGDITNLLSKMTNPLQALKLLYYAKTIKKSQAWLAEMNSSTYMSWEQLALIKENWTHGPILLKGIQSVEDARLAIKHGMDGVVVSNHGGRQVSGAVASLDALANICADPMVSSSDLTILFDSGIRTGSDVLKAMAIGADAILLGRPYIYGLACDGQRGVENVFKSLKADLEVTMGSMGIKELTKAELQGVIGITNKPKL